MYFVLVTFLFITGALCQQADNLYFVDYILERVYRMNLADYRYVDLSPPAAIRDPVAIGVDSSTGNIFIANAHLYKHNTPKFIIKYHPISRSTTTLNLPSSDQIGDLAVDSIAQLIYYTNRNDHTIVAMTTDLKYSTIIISNLKIPNGIALDPENKQIFWTEISSSFPHIGVANMDGSSQRTIVSRRGRRPYTVTLDRQENKIYWCDIISKTIERCNTDGSGQETLLTLPPASRQLISVAVDRTYVYWTQHFKGVIYRTRKYAGATKEKIGEQLPDNLTNYRSLKLTGTSEVQGITQCTRGNTCQHLCIPTPKSYVCRCAEGYVLQSDATSCQKAKFQRGLLITDVNRNALLISDLEHDTTKIIQDTWYDTPRGIVYDDQSQAVLWVDAARKAILKSCLPSACYEQVKMYSNPDSNLASLAIDSSGSQLYVVDLGLKSIFKLSLSGYQQDMIINTHPRRPYEIALDTKKKKVPTATPR